MLIIIPMIERPFWIQRIRHAWEKRPIVWLSGVRRAGKTTLAQMFPKAFYQNCNLLSVVRRLFDPESFYDSLDQEAIVIFDPIFFPSKENGIASHPIYVF